MPGVQSLLSFFASFCIAQISCQQHKGKKLTCVTLPQHMYWRWDEGTCSLQQTGWPHTPDAPGIPSAPAEHELAVPRKTTRKHFGIQHAT